MDLHQLRCFLIAADELHFGRAAQRLQMMPSALGRHIRLLEEYLGAQLFTRTTRMVSLTEDGQILLQDARDILTKADAVAQGFRDRKTSRRVRRFRIGAIDSAAAGLIPQLFRDLHSSHPDVSVHLFEDKTIRLVPKLVSGALDFAFIRPPERIDARIEILPLLRESPVVAVPEGHRFARRRSLVLTDIEHEPLIVPDRRSRPHSHDLTIKLFEMEKLKPRISEVADEKQTIVNLVAAGLGAAIVPKWTSRMAVTGVRFVKLKVPAGTNAGYLPLAAAWLRGVRDPLREMVVETVTANLKVYAESA